MKNKIILLGITGVLFVLTLFSSCKDDDEYVDRSQEENRVKVVVRSNTPGVPLLLEGFSLTGGYLYVKDYWEREVSTKAYTVGLIAKCEDQTVLVAIEIYVDGKLYSKVDGNSYVVAGAEIKKNRRKY